MPRLLAVVPTGDDPVSAAVLRALRDAGHEVVHAGGLARAETVAATAVQEDVELVLVMGDEHLAADDVRRLLDDAGADDVDLVVVPTGSSAADSFTLVRRCLEARA